MSNSHAHLQFDRLVRHHGTSLRDKDPISFLDLAHTLRVWVDMKSSVSRLASDSGLNIRFANHSVPKAAKNVLRGSRYTYLPLASGVESPGVQVAGFRFVNRALSPEEIRKLYEAGPPKQGQPNLDFVAWLGAGVYEVPSNDAAHPHIQLSREIIIKRVANILGASHPAGMEDGDFENRFDPYIKDLHRLTLADGYPATYYQLLEFAKDIIAAFRPLREHAA